MSEFWQCSWKEGFRILPRWKERKIFFLVGKKNETAREYPHFLRFHPFNYLSLKQGISQIGFIQGYTMMSEMRWTRGTIRWRVIQMWGTSVNMWNCHILTVKNWVFLSYCKYDLETLETKESKCRHRYDYERATVRRNIIMRTQMWVCSWRINVR